MRFFSAISTLFLVLTGAAWANSITIGQLTYLGTSNGVSDYQLKLDTTGITASPLTLVNSILSVGGQHENTGQITSTSVILFTGGAGLGLPSCPCNSIGVQLVFSSTGQPFTFMLANGTSFTSYGTVDLTLLRADDHHLEPGDTVPITLTEVPEPWSLALVGTGLAALAFFLRFGKAADLLRRD
jgi:hypothetical protein